MAYKTVSIQDINSVVNGDPVSLIGKNGFNTVLGSIPILCNSYSKVDTTGDLSLKDGNIQFQVFGLSNLIDLNFAKHVLLVNDDPSFFGGLKGLDYISIPVSEKLNEGADIGQVGHNPTITQISLPIEGFNTSTNTIKVNNSVSPGSATSFLISKLPAAPFYLRISQVLDSSYFANNSMYLEGLSDTFTKTYSIEGISSAAYTVDINITPRYKSAISVYIDNEKQSQNIFSWDNKSNISFGATGGKLLTVRTDRYTVPVIEPGDNISLFSGNVYAISETSYNPTSPSYNVWLTANSIYRVKLATPITTNLSGVTAVNITNDIEGRVGNVNVGTKTFTIDYDNTVFSSTTELASYKVYNVAFSKTFESLELTKESIVRNVPAGNYVVRARNTNTFNRKSPYATKSTVVTQLPVGKVTDLAIVESLYRDKQVGIGVQAIVSFTPIANQSVTEYELSYKIQNINTFVDLLTYTTVKLPASGIAADGKIHYKIDNIERGSAAGVHRFFARVTPLNNDIRGITTEDSIDILGKTALPAGVARFSAAQLGDQILFSWTVPRDAAGDPVEIDLYQFEIRQILGSYSSADETIWNNSTIIGSAFANVSFLNAPVREYGTYTFLLRTRDTTGNQCSASSIAVYTVTTTRPENLRTFRAYSEDNPSANDYIVALTNNNFAEYYFPSYANSTNGGLSRPGSTRVENANGTAIGFSQASGITDIFAATNAVYYTQIRDLGQVISSRLTTSVNVSQSVNTRYNDLREIIFTGVSDGAVSGQPSYFKDIVVPTSNTSLGFYLSNATFDANNNTLVSGGLTGNVWAIWNPGQFVGDVANSNSYALIRRVDNANGIIELSRTYFANGVYTGGNTLSNLTSNPISYELVNLLQYNDILGSTYTGPSGAVSYNVDYRYSTANSVYYSNGNVNTQTFVGFATNDGWVPLTESDTLLKYFQLRLSIVNSNPSQVSTILDKFRYAVNLSRKTFSTSNTINAATTTIDYSAAGFTIVPVITVTQVSGSSPVVPIVSSKNIANCNVSLYFSSNGTSATGITVDLMADGA